MYHHIQLLIGVHSPAVCVQVTDALISCFLPGLEVAETQEEPVSCLRCFILGSLGLASVLWLSSFSVEDIGKLKQQTQHLEQVSANFNEGPLRTIFGLEF